MQADRLYKETICAWVFTALFGFLSALFLFMEACQLLKGPLGENPPPDWLFMLIALLFLGIALNFNKLNVKMTQSSVIVGYGILKRTIPWENIERCYVDEVSNIRYGGWGMRIGLVKGNWRLVYNVIGAPRVVLSLKLGWFGAVVFSTRNPEAVMRIVRQRIGRME
jgi:hypothetical protein